MTAIPQQSLEFLSNSAPFDQLSSDDLRSVAQQVHVAYVTQENAEQILSEQSGKLYLISSGQFSIKDNDGPIRHLSEGDYFGYSNLLDNLSRAPELEVDSAGLVYCISAQSFQLLLEDNPSFSRFFRDLNADQIQTQAVNDSKSMWLYKRIEDGLKREPISTDVATTIIEAVKLMSEQQVSSLLITRQQKACRRYY